MTQTLGKAHVRVPAPEHDSKTFSAGWESGVTLKRKWCPVAGIDMAEMNSEVMIEDCAVPHYEEKVDYEFLKDVKTCFVAPIILIEKFVNICVACRHLRMHSYTRPAADKISVRDRTGYGYSSACVLGTGEKRSLNRARTQFKYTLELLGYWSTILNH